jgi:hypothetical protein
MERITLTQEEAENIVKLTLKSSGINMKLMPDAFTNKMIDGVKQLFEGLQDSGWILKRPEK